MTDARDTTDAAWVRKALDRHEASLVRYAARLTGNLDLGREVVQETFLRLCREDPARLDGRVSEWLFSVCRNRALDVRRKERRMKTLAEPETDALAHKGPDPTSGAEDRDQHRLVLGVLAGLPENQQEVVRLRFDSQLSYRQISEVTGLTVSNVGFLVHTAIQKLRHPLLRDVEAPQNAEGSES